MTPKLHLKLVILLLLVTGLSLFLYKWLNLGLPLKPTDKTESWTIEASLQFNPGSGPVKANFYIPGKLNRFYIVDENFISKNYGVIIRKSGDNRTVTWSVRRAKGQQKLYYRVVVAQNETTPILQIPKPPTPMTFSEQEKSAAEAVVAQARSKSADILTFTTETLKIINNPSNSNARLLLGRVFLEKDVAKVVSKVLSLAHIQSQLAHGIFLDHLTRPEMITWLVVYDGRNWHYIDPSTGDIGLPDNLFIWYYGDSPLFSVSGGSQSKFVIDSMQNQVDLLTLAKQRGKRLASSLIKFSLLDLPIQTQKVYRILLTIPIGAFIILLLRNFIGITTFGTFMPVLIALAFRETQILLGVTLFTLIVSLGLLARFYLDQLRLLLIPRLTAILTIVVILMILISILSQRLDVIGGLSIALFPMVIITMTIERMCILWDERGAYESIKAGIGSLIAASLAYSVMHLCIVEYLLITFPELLLILLSLTLMLGQYHGYRLTELIRFKALANLSQKSND